MSRDQEYIFRIFAENRFGRSDPLDSSPVLVQYPFSRPGVPGQPEVLVSTRDSITISWNNPTSDGGTNSEYYYVLKHLLIFFLFLKAIRFLLTMLKRKTETLCFGPQLLEVLQKKQS